MRPRLQEIVVHQRLRLRLWWPRSMMSMCSARENTQAMSAMAINSRGIEAFACVRGGGACLMAGAGHVAVGRVALPTDRRTVAISLREERSLPRAIDGLGHRRLVRGKLCAGPDGCLCVAVAAASPSMGGDMLKRTIRQWEIR